LNLSKTYCIHYKEKNYNLGGGSIWFLQFTLNFYLKFSMRKMQNNDTIYQMFLVMLPIFQDVLEQNEYNVENSDFDKWFSFLLTYLYSNQHYQKKYEYIFIFSSLLITRNRIIIIINYNYQQFPTLIVLKTKNQNIDRNDQLQQQRQCIWDFYNNGFKSPHRTTNCESLNK
jgi:hypothetical protein